MAVNAVAYASSYHSEWLWKDVRSDPRRRREVCRVLRMRG